MKAGGSLEPGVGRRRAGLLTAAMLLVAGTGFGAVQTVTIGDLYDGGTVNLAPGDTLEVRLSASPAAGCAWAVAFDDPAVLKPQADGAPESPVFRFKAAATGSASLGLACRKSSDPTSPPGGLYRVLVVVKETVLPRGLLLEEPDNGSEIFLAQGDVIAVKLPSNPSTGYSWSIASNAPAILQSAGDPKFEPPEKAKPGAGGSQTFEFRVAAGGGAWLQLVYRRPFEKDVAPARQWAIFVVAASVGP